MPAKIDIKGKRFNRLVVLGESNKRKTGHVYWLCQCDCGNIVEVRLDCLKRGHTRSCSCLQKEWITNHSRKINYKHGYTKTRLFKTWQGMKNRCCNRSTPVYKYYGAKGIEVCLEWEKEFIKFKDWALQNGYRDNLVIDRISHKGNYEPNNCRWVTKSESSSRTVNEQLENERKKEKDSFVCSICGHLFNCDEIILEHYLSPLCIGCHEDHEQLDAEEEVDFDLMRDSREEIRELQGLERRNYGR